MKLESGPAAYDRNYKLVIALFGILMGAYFLYDHYVGYSKKNYEQAKQHLTPLLGEQRMPETLPERPGANEVAELRDAAPDTLEAVRESLGNPLFVVEDQDTSVGYFVSIYGMARVPVERGRVNASLIEWRSWDKSQDDIQMQLYCAYAAFAFGLFMLSRAVKAAGLRVVIDDEGLVYARRRILFENMTRLCDFNRKGWVDLYYKHGAEERKLRFDNQKVRKFNEIIEVLCECKGFEDPREAADESATAAEPAQTPEADADDANEKSA